MRKRRRFLQLRCTFTQRSPAHAELLGVLKIFAHIWWQFGNFVGAQRVARKD
jgi:hypothetical protein